VRFSRVAKLTVLASLMLAPPAEAQDEGVFIDPDSPSAKEYKLPLESERRQADPGQEPGAGIVQGSRSSPIFGAGIVNDDEGEAESGSARRSSRSMDRGDRAEQGSDRAGSRRAERDDRDAEVLQAATSNPGPPDGGIGMPLTIGGLAVGVLILGGLTGLLLRRRA
jgi:hypothetical protein